MTPVLLAPELLHSRHRLAEFSGSLGEWLKRWAIADQANGASGTYVTADERGRVYGYYALAAGMVHIRRDRGKGMEPTPVLVLCRLAVDRRLRGRRIGAGLLRDAVNRAANVAAGGPVRALLVHAMDDQAKAFYQHYGFRESPFDPTTLMLPLRMG